jgi:hypothetical protein
VTANGPVSHPNAPKRGPVYLAYGAVVLAGILGGVIGYGLVNATCSDQAPKLQRLLHLADPRYQIPAHSCQLQRAGGLLSGAVIAGVGAGIVAVLVLRAMTDWRPHPPQNVDPGGDADVEPT